MQFSSSQICLPQRLSPLFGETQLIILYVIAKSKVTITSRVPSMHKEYIYHERVGVERENRRELLTAL